MTIHEFGDKGNPVILLLPGTMCYWKGNFGGVIDDLAEHFLVAVVSYTGFEETDKENYVSLTDEVTRIEEYVKKHYNGSVLAVYGCSLGGSLLAHLAARHNIRIKYGIIGSSDLEQASKLKAWYLTSVMIKVIYNFIHTGKYKSSMMQERYEAQMQDEDPYQRAYVSMTGRDKYDMSFITKESLKNQYKSDLVTPLPQGIANGETVIHVFYAEKMGEKYLDRYKDCFKDPIIHTHDMRHEELLCVHPDDWCALVKKICLGIEPAETEQTEEPTETAEPVEN